MDLVRKLTDASSQFLIPRSWGMARSHFIAVVISHHEEVLGSLRLPALVCLFLMPSPRFLPPGDHNRYYPYLVEIHLFVIANISHRSYRRNLHGFGVGGTWEGVVLEKADVGSAKQSIRVEYSVLNKC